MIYPWPHRLAQTPVILLCPTSQLALSFCFLGSPGGPRESTGKPPFLFLIFHWAAWFHSDVVASSQGVRILDVFRWTLFHSPSSLSLPPIFFFLSLTPHVFVEDTLVFFSKEKSISFWRRFGSPPPHNSSIRLASFVIFFLPILYQAGGSPRPLKSAPVHLLAF